MSNKDDDKQIPINDLKSGRYYQYLPKIKKWKITGYTCSICGVLRHGVKQFNKHYDTCKNKNNK